jgi:hypothetical protein
MEKIVSTVYLNKLPHRYQVMFAIFCAEQVIGLVREQDREVCLKAIEVAKRWLRGEVSEEECKAAAGYASATGANAAAYASGAAPYAAHAAARAARAAYASVNAADAAFAAIYAAGAADIAHAAGGYADKNRNKVIKEQWGYYNELLNLDENLEKILVG